MILVLEILRWPLESSFELFIVTLLPAKRRRDLRQVRGYLEDRCRDVWRDPPVSPRAALSSSHILGACRDQRHRLRFCC